MKKLAAITLTSMMLLLATAMVVGAVDSVVIRGAVAGTVNGQSNLESDSFTWNPQNFAGFYYDIKKDIGTEKIVTTLTEGNKLSGDAPYGVTYTTTAQPKDYEFEDWGSYNVIGFQAEKYFAGYITSEDAAKNVFFKESTDENSLSSEQLEKISLMTTLRRPLHPAHPSSWKRAMSCLSSPLISTATRSTSSSPRMAL